MSSFPASSDSVKLAQSVYAFCKRGRVGSMQIKTIHHGIVIFFFCCSNHSINYESSIPEDLNAFRSSFSESVPVRETSVWKKMSWEKKKTP